MAIAQTKYCLYDELPINRQLRSHHFRVLYNSVKCYITHYT